MRKLSILPLTFLFATPALAATPEQIAQAALAAAPVWDGHNDVPDQLRGRRKDVLESKEQGAFDFNNTLYPTRPMHTDLARLRQGHVGAQFWSVFVPVSLTGQQAVQAVMEQIDVTKRLIARYPGQLQYAASAAEVESAMKAGRIASLMGMEGGYAIAGSLGVLRQFYALGVRYMTLTHFKTTEWADSATDAPQHDGLTLFGKDVVREMQRIGMLVDLSHVSEGTMLSALDVAKAPVIFSHSGARAVAHHPRNVPDTVLDRMAANGGIVMVDTDPPYVSDRVWNWANDRAAAKAHAEGRWIGYPDQAKAELADWDKAHPEPRATLQDVADHIDHIVKRAGIDHVGLGGDYDGIGETVEGMGDVSTYPALFTELARRGYSQADLEKLASRNMMRVLKAAEAYAAAHRNDPPLESPTRF